MIANHLFQMPNNKTVNFGSEKRFTRYIYLFSALALFVACEQSRQRLIHPQKRKKVTLL